MFPLGDMFPLDDSAEVTEAVQHLKDAEKSLSRYVWMRNHLGKSLTSFLELATVVSLLMGAAMNNNNGFKVGVVLFVLLVASVFVRPVDPSER
ncbi:MAG: hypothetical protein LBT40_16310 [Deltaproteobacteria bacterium]|jgi:hypothetical protein|nr:hypothetical protein [Deltaproteobacteria bacterium]